MKILVVGINWPPETFIARLIQGLISTGVSVGVATAKRPSEEWLSKPGFEWIWIPKYPKLKSVILNCAVPKWGVIYFPWNSAAVENLSLLKKMPCVVSCRGSQINVAPHNPNRQSFVQGLKEIFNEARSIHCVSHAIKKKAVAYGLNPEKACVIHPAIDTSIFIPRLSRRANPSLKIVTTGGLNWVKGHEYALMSIRKLIDQEMEIQFEIIGDGPERQRMLYTIQDLGLEKNVTLLGKLEPEAVRNRLQQADIFLLSSLSEGISNAVLEAMACGLPIVTTDCGGMREAVTDGVEGFVVPVRDPGAMAKRIQQLAESAELRAEMGRAARLRAENDFKIEDQIRQFIKLFEEAKALRRV